MARQKSQPPARGGAAVLSSCTPLRETEEDLGLMIVDGDELFFLFDAQYFYQTLFAMLRDAFNQEAKWG